MKPSILIGITLAVLMAIGNAQAATKTFTGVDLLSEPGVTFPTIQPTVNGTSIVFGPGGIIDGKLLVLPIYPAGTFSSCSAVPIPISINLTRLLCDVSFGCAGEGDWDPTILLGDGVYLMGSTIGDTLFRSAAVQLYSDNGVFGSQVFTEDLFGVSDFPGFGESLDIDMIFTLDNTYTEVDVSYLDGSGSFIFSTALDCTAELNLVILRDNDLGEQYQVNSVTIPSVETIERDQGQIFSTGGALQLGTDEWSQSITTGIKGQLAEIQIQFHVGVPTPPPALNLSIFNGGNPISGSALFSEQLFITSADLDDLDVFMWDLSSARLFFDVGDVFSLVLQADGAGYEIAGNDPPGYDGGDLFKNRVVFPALSDIAFITYVKPGPIPPPGVSESIYNGGFETGDFTGWNVTTLGSGGCNTDWNVGDTGSATGCEPIDNPVEGRFAAYNSFDGAGPLTYQLTQSILIPTSINNAAVLSWQDTAFWDITEDDPTQDRVFSVDLFDSSGTVLLGNIFSLNYPAQSHGNYDWTLRSEDISSILSEHTGKVLTLSFSNFIPEEFTGPAGFGLDAVSLQLELPVVTIDIKPGNKRNVINPRAKGGIWVAIFSDTGPESPFDPSSQVDIPTVEFGSDGAKAIRHKVKDLNKDGLGDLLLRFKIPKTGIACGDTEATLTGETFDSQGFTGTDTIKTVGCKPKKCHKNKHHKKHYDDDDHDNDKKHNGKHNR